MLPKDRRPVRRHSLGLMLRPRSRLSSTHYGGLLSLKDTRTRNGSSHMTRVFMCVCDTFQTNLLCNSYTLLRCFPKSLELEIMS